MAVTTEATRQAALKLIYRHTHRDFKTVVGGAKCVMQAGALVALEDFTAADIAARLPRALEKENDRLALKAGSAAE